MILNETEFHVGSTRYFVMFGKYYKASGSGKAVEISKEEYYKVRQR